MVPHDIEIDWRIRVFDSLSYPTRILQPDGTIIAVNDVFLKDIGEIQESIVGLTCREANKKHFPKQTFPCDNLEKCPLCKTIKHKTGQSVLLHTVDRNGEGKWEDRVFSPILGDDGEIKYIIESIRDVTKVKKLEKLYTDVRELIDKVVQSSVSGIIAANRRGEIILANQAAEDLFGYSAEEVTNVHIESFYPDGVARGIMKKLRDEDLGGKGKLPITKVDIVNKSGEKIPVEMTAAIIYENGEEEATAGIFNDLREKLNVEKKLQEAETKIGQTEKMASLGRLAAGVAHEINNPLTSILLYGNMMREKLEREHPLSQNLDYVLEDAERCREIVKNLLAYSRQSSPSREVFPLNSLVTDSLKLIHDQRLFMNVRVVKQLVDHEVLVRADKTQICQVVINLVLNAVDAMEEKGILTLATRWEKDTGKSYLEVSDTGCGIAQEDVSKIFDPFFTTKELGKGTGLGLSMAYGVMEENQGRIFIKNTDSEGTTIALELPVVTISNEILFDSIG
jgi:two-component system NtrC family sensor kinase